VLLNLLKNNFGLKLLAVGLALTAWGYFHLAAAPGTTARFDQTLAVPIVVTGLRTGYQARYADKVATVVIEVPRNGTMVKPDQVQAVLDIGDLVDPGFHNVPVKIVSPDVAIKSLSPASVTLSLDRVEEHRVPVSIDYVGDRRGIVVESAQVDPTMTTIRGVAADLSRVAAVRVEIPMPDKPQELDKMIRPTPSDAQGSEITDVQVSPNLVRVRARFIGSKGAQPRATR
jgi:hypothetical protein